MMSQSGSGWVYVWSQSSECQRVSQGVYVSEGVLEEGRVSPCYRVSRSHGKCVKYMCDPYTVWVSVFEVRVGQDGCE